MNLGFQKTFAKFRVNLDTSFLVKSICLIQDNRLFENFEFECLKMKLSREFETKVV
jgi:hypothetical protein